MCAAKAAKPAEKTEAPDDEAAADVGAAVKPPRFSKKKLVIIIALAVFALGGGGAGLYFSGILHSENPSEVTIMLPDPPVFQEMQRITVDLKPSAQRQRPFIRLSMQAELQGETARAAFVASETKIMDAIQSHLRDTTADELQGENGTEALRNDITTIINRIIKPEIAITVLYKEILIR